MLAISLESVVKLVAMIAVGVFAYLWLGDNAFRVTHSARTLFENAPPVGFIAQTLLGFLAIVCLPRQFPSPVVASPYVGVIPQSRCLLAGY